MEKLQSSYDDSSEQKQLLFENMDKIFYLSNSSLKEGNLFFDNLKELSILTNNDLKSVIQNEFPFKWWGKSAFHHECKIGVNFLTIHYSQSNGSSICFNFDNDKYDNEPVTIEETIECIKYYETVCNILHDFNTKLSKILQSFQVKDLLSNL